MLIIQVLCNMKFEQWSSQNLTRIAQKLRKLRIMIEQPTCKKKMLKGIITLSNVLKMILSRLYKFYEIWVLTKPHTNRSKIKNYD
jgi:hypothetical protein